MEAKIEQLEITGNYLTEMCRLCLSRNMTIIDVFRFSSEFGKEVADIIMECAPVQITRHDKMPTYICQLCFTQLKTFHQFQMQAVQSDRTLQRYLQNLSDCHPQIKAELAIEELSNNSVSENYNADVTTKSGYLEISNGFDNLISKQSVLTNFSAVNKTTDEIYLKSEIKDEPIDDNYLNSAECTDTVRTLVMRDGTIRCEDSVIEIGDSKVGIDTPGNFESSLKIESDMTQKMPVKSEETYKPLKEGDSSLYSENIKECLRSNEDNMNRTEHPSKRQNFNESVTSTGGKAYHCNICQKCFTYACNLKSHKLIHTGEKPYQCAICETRFRHKVSLKNHKFKHTGAKPYQCNICKMCFTQKTSLKTHELKHTREKPYQCDICQMCLKNAHNLKKHKLIHTGEKPYRCDICEMCFRNSTSLKSHKLKHTGEKPYQCDICKMCFRLNATLKGHKLKHTGEKPYQCDICQMCFRRVDELKNHKLVHTGEKPYQCDTCQMCFKYASNLKKHKLIHTGEKPYQCDICEMCFTQTGSLKSHKLKHTGEKPYQCDICKVCFRHYTTFKSHKLKHTGEKPHQCDICQMCFRHPRSLKTHKFKHTGEKPHQCDICQMCFRHHSTFKKHKLKHME